MIDDEIYDTAKEETSTPPVLVPVETEIFIREEPTVEQINDDSTAIGDVTEAAVVTPDDADDVSDSDEDDADYADKSSSTTSTDEGKLKAKSKFDKNSDIIYQQSDKLS